MIVVDFSLGVIDFLFGVTSSHSPILTLCLADSQADVTARSRSCPRLPTTTASYLTSCKCFSLPQVLCCTYTREFARDLRIPRVDD